MTIDGRAYRKRADAGLHLLALLRQEAAAQLGYRQRTLPAGELGGLPLTATIGRTPRRRSRSPWRSGRRARHRTQLTATDLAERRPSRAHLPAGEPPRPARSAQGPGPRRHRPRPQRDRARHRQPRQALPPSRRTRPPPATASRQIDEQLQAAATPQPAEPEPRTKAETSGDGVPEAAPRKSHMEQEPNQQIPRSTEAPTRPGNARPPWPSAAERADRTDAFPLDPPEQGDQRTPRYRTTPHAVTPTGSAHRPIRAHSPSTLTASRGRPVSCDHLAAHRPAKENLRAYGSQLCTSRTTVVLYALTCRVECVALTDVQARTKELICHAAFHFDPTFSSAL